MSILNYFFLQIANNIPFYVLAVGLLVFNMYIKKSFGLNKKWVVLLLMSCLFLSLFSSVDKSIESYLNILKKDALSYNLSLKAYSDLYTLNLDRYNILRNLYAALAYCLRITISMFSYFLINREKESKIKLVISSVGFIGILLCLTSPFTKLIFYFDDLYFEFNYGPLYLLIYFVMFFYFIHIFIELMKRYSNNRKTLFYLFFLILFVSIFILLESLEVIETQVDLSSMLFLVAVVLYYILIESHLYFEEMENKEKALYDSKVAVMTSQVRPHFIFNCIGNIVELCDEDSKARKALINFSKYLRVNINSLNETRAMLFDNELMYIENYVYLEKMRYPNKFEVEYKIKTTDFLVPLISIEIFVENAIKHNVGKKDDVVHITIKTIEDDDNYIIEVKDDGVGFDVATVNTEESVGIKNAKYRLENLVQANVKIDSVINEGTIVTVTIPKESGEE